jgi:hypothetical protein
MSALLLCPAFCMLHAEHYVDDLEMELTDALLGDFQLEAEDGSPRQVAGTLVALYQACCRNDAGPLQQLRQQQAAAATSTRASRPAAVSHAADPSTWYCANRQCGLLGFDMAQHNHTKQQAQRSAHTEAWSTGQCSATQKLGLHAC